MIAKSVAPDKPGQLPASTEIRPADALQGADTTGTNDDDPASVTLPMVGAIPPIDTRDRSDGGRLDRTAWAYDFGRRSDLTKPERAVLLYLVHRAGPQRFFECADSETIIGEWTGYARKAVGTAIKGLIQKGAIAQVRSGKGGNPITSKYQLRGNQTSWRINEKPNHPNVSPGDIDLSQCVPETHPMCPGDPIHPVNPYLPVVDSPEEESTTTGYGHPPEVAAEAALLSSDSFQKSDNPVCDWENDSGEPCDTAKFRNEDCCLAHLVATWWKNPETGELELGATWTKGIRVAIRWYSTHPDSLVEQIADLREEQESRAEAEANARIIRCVGCRETPVADYGQQCESCIERDRWRMAELGRQRAEDAVLLSPTHLRFRAAARELGRVRGTKFNIGALMRDVPGDKAELAGATLHLPFRGSTNRDRFADEYAIHEGVILETIAKHLPGVASIETRLLEGE